MPFGCSTCVSRERCSKRHRTRFSMRVDTVSRSELGSPRFHRDNMEHRAFFGDVGLYAVPGVSLARSQRVFSVSIRCPRSHAGSCDVRAYHDKRGGHVAYSDFDPIQPADNLQPHDCAQFHVLRCVSGVLSFTRSVAACWRVAFQAIDIPSEAERYAWGKHYRIGAAAGSKVWRGTRLKDTAKHFFREEV